MRPQDELVRVVRTAGGELEVGRTLPGRGAWVCADDDRCFDMAVKRKAFARALRAPVEPAALERLRAKGVNSARMDGRAHDRERPRKD